MLASSGSPRDSRRTLAEGLAGHDAGNYLVTDRSCASFNQSIRGHRIFAAYLGPFPDLDSACQIYHGLADSDAYVRRLDVQATGRSVCSCLDTAGTLPELDHQTDAQAEPPRQYLVSDAQALLYRAGHNPDQLTGGWYGDLTRTMVTRFQRATGLVVTGRMDEQTWASLVTYCRSPE